MTLDAMERSQAVSVCSVVHPAIDQSVRLVNYLNALLRSFVQKAPRLIDNKSLATGPNNKTRFNVERKGYHEPTQD